MCLRKILCAALAAMVILMGTSCDVLLMPEISDDITTAALTPESALDGSGEEETNIEEEHGSLGLEYVSNGDGTCSIRRIGTCTDTDIVIPKKHKGEVVTSIGEYAFYNCPSLTSVVIPDSVTSIGRDAFYNCSGLTSVVIPDNVTSIGEVAFGDCSGLTSIVIPDGVTIIGEHAFSNCSGLTSVVIPDGVTCIERGSFSGCSGLTSVVIPDSVTIIGEWAFSDCSSLTSVVIPDSLTCLDNTAFSNCDRLTKITVEEENPVYHSKGNCLIETESKTLVIGCQTSIIPTDGSVTSIGNGAFGYCSGLTSIVIPDGVTSIKMYTFCGCSDLTFLIIPDSVTSIEEHAFLKCSDLTSIVIPDSVVSIGGAAFYLCPALTDIYFTGTESEWEAITKGEVWDANTGAYTIHFNYVPN